MNPFTQQREFISETALWQKRSNTYLLIVCCDADNQSIMNK